MFDWLLTGATLGAMCPAVIVPGQSELPTNYTPVHAEVSAYTSRVVETDSTPHITASGVRTHEGVIACPPRYEFGTEVIINDNTYTCYDRMNQRYHGRNVFDIWMETVPQAREWGRRELTIYVEQ